MTVARDGPFAFAGRIDDVRALVFKTGKAVGGSIATDTEVVGVAAASGDLVPLGTVEVHARGCSWDSASLLCPTADGFRVWRFAAD